MVAVVSPFEKEGLLLLTPPERRGVMFVTWDAIYKIAEILVQTGILTCAVITLIHMKKK